MVRLAMPELCVVESNSCKLRRHPHPFPPQTLLRAHENSASAQSRGKLKMPMLSSRKVKQRSTTEVCGRLKEIGYIYGGDRVTESGVQAL